MSTISASTTSTTAFKITTDTTGALVFQTGASPTTAVTFDASQNVGVGVTPSAWSGFTALQVGNTAIWTTSTNNTHLSSNLYYNGSARIYIGSNYATEYAQQNGEHKWFYAASGTAGDAISFTQAMTLDASGNLLLGTTTSSGYNMTVSGASSTVTGSKTINTSGSSSNLCLFATSSSYASFGVSANSGWLAVEGANNLTIGPTGAGAVTVVTNGSERARIDSSGTLVLGVTPSSWNTITPLQIKNASFGGYTAGTTYTSYVGSNWYYNSGDKYISNGLATVYTQTAGQHLWYSAGSGTAGNAISFNQVMSLSTGGMLTASAGYTNLFTPILSSYQTTSPAAANILLVGSPNDRDCWVYRDPAGGADNWGIYHRNIDSTVASLPGNSIGFIGANSLAAYIDLQNKTIRSMTAVDQPYMMVARTNGYTVADGFTGIQYDVLVHSRYMSHTSGVNMYFEQPGKYLIITGWRFGAGSDVWTGVRLLDNDGTVRGLGFATGQFANDPGPCTIQFIADIPAARTGQAMAMQFIRAGSTMGIATPASGSYGYAIVTTVIQIGV